MTSRGDLVALSVHVPHNWISRAQLEQELATARLENIDHRRMERWREDGLLPSVVQRVTPGHGSEVFYPPTTARQVAAIVRFKAVKDKNAYIGLGLWAAGFEVRSTYWEKALVKADRLRRRLGPVVDLISAAALRSPNQPTFGEFVASGLKLNGPPARMSRRLSAAEQAMTLDLIGEVLTGDFDDFSHGVQVDNEFDPESVIAKAFDFHVGMDDQILGAKLKLIPLIQGSLRNLSRSQVGFAYHDFSLAEVQQARDDVRNSLKITFCFYEAMRWIYGDSAFGLRTAAQLARNTPGSLVLAFTLGFARLRRVTDDLIETGEISRLSHIAELTFPRWTARLAFWIRRMADMAFMIWLWRTS